MVVLVELIAIKTGLKSPVFFVLNQGFEGLKTFKSFAVLTSFILPLLDSFFGFSPKRDRKMLKNYGFVLSERENLNIKVGYKNTLQELMSCKVYNI